MIKLFFLICFFNLNVFSVCLRNTYTIYSEEKKEIAKKIEITLLKQNTLQSNFIYILKDINLIIKVSINRIKDIKEFREFLFNLKKDKSNKEVIFPIEMILKGEKINKYYIFLGSTKRGIITSFNGEEVYYEKLLKEIGRDSIFKEAIDVLLYEEQSFFNIEESTTKYITKEEILPLQKIEEIMDLEECYEQQGDNLLNK